MTPTFTMNEDKTTVKLKAKIELFCHSALTVLPREREKICKLQGVPKPFQLDFCLKNVREGFDRHLDRFLPLHTTAGLKEAIGADPYIHCLVPTVGLSAGPVPCAVLPV